MRGKEMNAEQKGMFLDKNGRNTTKSPATIKRP